MTHMTTMPIYGKKLKKSSSPEPIDQWPWNMVCSIVYASTTKIVQIMTLGWPWPILRQGQIWSHRLLYGRKWKLFIFGNYCSLRSQSCLMHSAKWVNEVEWVSKVKVILWPWSKVTQISKLNVWLWPVYSGERFRASWPSCFICFTLSGYDCSFKIHCSISMPYPTHQYLYCFNYQDFTDRGKFFISKLFFMQGNL